MHLDSAGVQSSGCEAWYPGIAQTGNLSFVPISEGMKSLAE